MFKVVTFGTPSPYIYSLSYAGAMLSWGIVIYKAFGVPQVRLNSAHIRGYPDRAFSQTWHTFNAS